jgi:hypothetical protein
MVAYVVLVAVSLAIASILLGSRSFAQIKTPQEQTSNSVTIEVANKFQQVVPPNKAGMERRALTIQNNNSNADNCWVHLGSDKASQTNSNLLAPGASYIRYWPFASSDAIQATCASGSDTLQVEYQ